MIRSAPAKKSIPSKAGRKGSPAPMPPDGRSIVATSTKLELLESMLRRPEGATTSQIMVALSWQKHSVRGAISGALRKKRHLNVDVEESKDGERIYRISEQP
jgi:hypothetical protein